jgi:hypothetical protein
MQCAANAGVPPTVRAEALADYVADLILNCTGGTPTPSGTPVPKADITVKLNVNVASRLLKGQLTEALLLIDELHSGTNASISLLACGEPGSNDNGAGVCSITGSGSGATTYNGSTGRPNVFQGELTAPDTITWKSVPIDAPGAVGTQTLRFTNIRANASTLGASKTIVPNMLTAAIAITPGGVAVSGDVQTVAFIQRGLAVSAGAPAALSQCATANGAIAVDASKPLETGGQNGVQFSVTLKEGYASAFKVRNFTELQLNATPASPDANQNIPGAVYNMESGFFNGAIDPQSPPFYLPSPPVMTTAFSVNGLNLAGKADSGTRVYLKFSPVPSGMKLFAPVRVALTGGVKNGEAILIATDSAGNGVYSPVPGNQDGFAPLSITSGVVMAVYEIAAADPFAIESLTVNVAAAYVANAAPGQPAAGAINIEAGLAPIGAAAFPQFVAGQFTSPAFNIQSCTQPDLTVAVTHGGNLTQGDAGRAFSIVVANSGGASTSGAVTVIPALPSGLTATAISGAGWTCALAPLGCSRADSLPAGASYPAIRLNVDVDLNAAANLSVTASVSGGGEAVTSNDTASDAVTVIPLPSITVTTSPAGLIFTVDGFSYTSPQSLRWPAGAKHKIGVG